MADWVSERISADRGIGEIWARGAMAPTRNLCLRVGLNGRSTTKVSSAEKWVELVDMSRAGLRGWSDGVTFLGRKISCGR